MIGHCYKLSWFLKSSDFAVSLLLLLRVFFWLARKRGQTGYNVTQYSSLWLNHLIAFQQYTPHHIKLVHMHRRNSHALLKLVKWWIECSYNEYCAIYRSIHSWLWSLLLLLFFCLFVWNEWSPPIESMGETKQHLTEKMS